MAFSEEMIEKVWLKAPTYSTNPKWAKDACGAWICKDSYGKDSEYGWTIDHIYPKALGGDDSEINLRPLHFANNKSKAHDFPYYDAAITSEVGGNIKLNHFKSIYKELFDKLKALYHFNINYPY